MYNPCTNMTIPQEFVEGIKFHVGYRCVNYSELIDGVNYSLPRFAGVLFTIIVCGLVAIKIGKYFLPKSGEP